LVSKSGGSGWHVSYPSMSRTVRDALVLQAHVPDCRQPEHGRTGATWRPPTTRRFSTVPIRHSYCPILECPEVVSGIEDVMELMKAAVFRGPGTIEIEERKKPVARAGEAVIRVTTTTICGTDVH